MIIFTIYVDCLECLKEIKYFLVNLAVALKLIAPARNVGLLDADVFGPSIPHMMNLNEQPLLDDTNLMLPLTNHGIKWYMQM